MRELAPGHWQVRRSAASRVAEAEDTLAWIRGLRARSGVRRGIPDYRTTALATPLDEPLYADAVLGQRWHYELINLPLAWQLAPEAGAGVTVAVLRGIEADQVEEFVDPEELETERLLLSKASYRDVGKALAALGDLAAALDALGVGPADPGVLVRRTLPITPPVVRRRARRPQLAGGAAGLALWGLLRLLRLLVRRGVALSALYASANGSHWNNSEGWMAGDPCTSSWYGVSCKTDRFGATLLRVVALHENRLEGTLPTQLGHLSFVSNLVLSSNHNDNATRGSLRGCLPTQLGSMTALSVAKAFGERLSGQIPTQLGRWTALTIAALQRNSLGGSLPTQLGDLSSLSEGLYLDRNQVGGSIPTELAGALTALVKDFSLETNSLVSTLPTQLASLASLTRNLLLASNHLFAGVPSEVGRLGGGGGGGGGGNLFAKGLDLRNNSLTAALPTQLGLLSAMTGGFSVVGNVISGVLPSELGAWTAIGDEFRVDRQSLAGQLPSELGRLTALTGNFSVNGQRVGGTIPTEMGNLVNLIGVVDVGGNDLTGPVPSELGRLAQLQRSIVLRSNLLSKALPTHLGSLASASEDFLLQGNRLQGPIPSELGKLTKLTGRFDLSDNNATGTLPTELGSLSELQAGFNVEVNMLSKSLPTEVSGHYFEGVFLSS